MQGPNLSYEERVAMLADDVIRIGYDANLSDNEVMLLKALLDRRNGNVAAFAEETEKGLRLTKIGAELFGDTLKVAGKLPRISPVDVFWALHKAVIMVPMECVIVRPSIEEAEETLLAKRESNDPFFPGEEWHSPGVIMGVSETHLDAVRRCVARETSCEVKRWMAVAANNVPNFCRGHERSQISVVELVQGPTAETTEKQRLGWFRLDNLPTNTLRCHVPIHAKVKKWLDYYRSLPDRAAQMQFLQATCPIESLEPNGG